MSVSETDDSEVEGSIVSVIHVDESDTEPTRTVLALATKGDLSFSVSEDNEDFNPGTERRSRRYRTNNTIDVELTSAVSTDLAALELLGIADSDGKLTFDKSAREILEADDAYVEIAYWADEPDFSSVDIEADAELLHRFVDVEVVASDLDPSATPPTFSATLWVEGDVWLNYSSGSSA